MPSHEVVTRQSVVSWMRLFDNDDILWWFCVWENETVWNEWRRLDRKLYGESVPTEGVVADAGRVPQC